MIIGRTQSRGLTMLYTIVIMMALTGLASLAVDLGRVEVAKLQLRFAADAASRYAVTGLSDGSYITRAQASAAENLCDGSAVSLLGSDVIMGRWDNGTFTAGTTLPNSVKITAYRTAARSTAIPLLWGALIGRSKCDVTAVSISSIASGGGGSGLVGLNAATIGMSGTMDSYNSNNAPYSSGASTHGDVASNGTLTLNNGAQIKGDAYYRSGYSATGGAAVVSPGTAYFNSTALSYADPVLPSSYYTVGAFNATSGSYTVTAGNYYFTSVNISGSVNVTIQGQVNIYCSGPVNITGALTTSGANPANFRIMTTTATSVNISNSSTFAADIYCPNSTVTLGGSGQFYGRSIGKTLAVSGSLNYHYDEALNNGNNTGSISLVK